MKHPGIACVFSEGRPFRKHNTEGSELPGPPKMLFCLGANVLPQKGPQVGLGYLTMKPAEVIGFPLSLRPQDIENSML